MPAFKRERSTFTQTRALACEGPADAAFLRALISSRGLPTFDILNPADRFEGARGGIDQIGALIEGFTIRPGFSDLTDILIVIDNDSNANTNLQKIQHQLANIKSHAYSIPQAFMQKAAGAPNVSIASWPWQSADGNLEKYCLEAAQSVDQNITACVDAFGQCVGADQWPSKNRIGKFKLRAIISAACTQNPTLPLGQIWDNHSHLVPLNHHSFDDLAQYLSTFQ